MQGRQVMESQSAPSYRSEVLAPDEFLDYTGSTSSPICLAVRPVRFHLNAAMISPARGREHHQKFACPRPPHCQPWYEIMPPYRGYSKEYGSAVVTSTPEQYTMSSAGSECYAGSLSG